MRFTAIFFGSLAAAAVLLVFWHAWQVSASTKLLWERAAAQESKQEWDELSRTLRRYLQAAPDDDKGWRLYAVAQDKRAVSFSDKEEAAQILKRVLARPGMTDDQALRLRSARLFLEANKFKDAAAEAQRVSEHGSPEQSREAKVIMAIASHDEALYGMVADPDWESIRANMEAALALKPTVKDDVELSTGLARLYRDTEIVLPAAEWTDTARKERADALMEDLVARYPRESGARLARYRYRLGFQVAKAEEDLEAATALAGEKDSEVWLTVGEGSLRGDLRDEATLTRAGEYFRKAIAAAPEDRRGYLGLVRALILQEELKRNGKGLEQAETALQDALKAIGTDDFELQLWLARVYLSTRQNDKFAKAMTELDRIRGANTVRWVDALRSLAQIETLRLSAEASMNSGHHAEALATLDKLNGMEQSLPAGAVESIPWATPAYRTSLMIGQCREALGEMDLAARAFERALTKSQDPEIYRAVVRAWNAAGRADLAAPYQEQLVASGEGDASAETQAKIRSLANSARSKQEWQAVLDLNAELKKDPQHAFSAWLLESQIKGLLNDQPGALASLRSAEQTTPTTPGAWRSLAIAYGGLDAGEDTQRCLMQFAKLAPAGDVALLQADILIRKQQFAAAEQILGKALAETKPAERSPIQLALVRILLAQARVAQAKTLLNEAAGAEDLKDREAIRLLAEIALVEKDWTELERLEAKIKTLDESTGTQWKYFRARRELAMPGGDVGEAVKLSAELSSARPDWLEGAELAGMVAEKQDKALDALHAYERALNLAIGTVAEARIANRYVELAVQTATNGGSLPAEVKSTLVNSRNLSQAAISRCVAQGHTALALELAADAAEARPADAVSYYWYGQVLALAGKTTEALSTLERATQLAPGSPLAWDAYLNVLVATGNSAGARTAVDRLSQAVALAEPAKSLLLARALEAVGDDAAAAKKYEFLLQQHAKEPDVRTSAIAFFLTRDPERAESLAREGLAASPQDQLMKRQLAAAVAATGKPNSLDEAASLLGAKGETLPLEEVDQRLFAQLLVKRPEKEERQRGIEILASIAGRKSMVPSQERLALVHLYEADGAHGKAIDSLRELVEKSSLAVPEHLALLVQYVTDHFSDATPEQKQAASDALASLKRLEGDSWRVFALDLRWNALVTGAGSSVDNVAIIKDRVNRDLPGKGSPQDKAALLGDAAALHLEFKNRAAAEECYREAAKLYPSGKLALAGFLAQGNSPEQLDEAIDLCMAASSDVGDSQAARALCTVLTLGGPNDEQKRKAEEWLRPRLAANPDDAGLLFSWGSYCLMSGDQSEAVKSLQQVLRTNPDNALARNNLAYLLASAGQGAEALQEVDRAIALAGATKSFRDTRGLALLAAKRQAEALSAFQQLTAESPEDPVVHLHLAAAQLAGGKAEEARATLQRAEGLELREAKLPEFDRQSLSSLRSAVGKSE